MGSIVFRHGFTARYARGAEDAKLIFLFTFCWEARKWKTTALRAKYQWIS